MGIAQVQRRSGASTLVRGRPPRPIPGNAVRDRITAIFASSAGAVTLPTDSFVLGTTKPDASNTGPRIAFGDAQVVAGTSGKVTYATSGQTITGKVFTCQVSVTGSNITFRDCWFYGSTLLKYVGAGLIDISGGNCRVEYCEITAYSGGVDRTRYWLNGVKTASGTTINRCNIHDVVDGISWSGTGVSLLGSFIHDLSFRSDDGDHTSDAKLPYWTHNDAIQFASASNYLIDGNVLSSRFSTVSGMVGNPSAPGITTTGTTDPARNHGVPAVGEWPNAHGMLIGPRSGTIANGQINRNWVNGGNYGIQITSQGRGFDTGNSGSFSGNRVYANQTGGAAVNPAQIVHAQSIGTFTGLASTIYAPDDTSVAAGWRGKPVQTPSTGGTYRYSSSITPPN